jgi:hypothetical protein
VQGLTLRAAARPDNKTGYFNVHLGKPGKPKPYQARATRGGKSVTLGAFATAEEAALCVARSARQGGEVASGGGNRRGTDPGANTTRLFGGRCRVDDVLLRPRDDGPPMWLR